MRRFNIAAALLVTGILAGCGGGGAGDQSPKVRFTSQVSFGDSLSDVGSYKVGTVAALGGGQFTINGTGKNWTELMAAQFGLPAPCPAQTGLDGTAAAGFSVLPVVNHAGCTSYAQGGARVTNPVGIGNKLTAAAGATTAGFLTVPVVTQIQNHLTAVGGSFTGTEIVFVMAGANDIFVQLNDAGAGTITPTTAVTNTATAATELVSYVNTQIIGNGAKYVVVVNVPDITGTPLTAAYPAPTKSLIDTMVTTFNSQLQAGLANNPKVLLVDAYTSSRDEVVHPAIYGLTNVTSPACNLTAPTNPLGSALACNSTNLTPGVVDHYMFSDDIHPTPYGYLLFARLVSKEMLVKGWL